MNITFQTAVENDSLVIADMINFASGGVVEFLFHDLITGMTPAQMIAFSLKEDKNYHTYKNAITAICDNIIIGMIMSYSSEFHCIDEEMRAFVPRERIEYMKDIYESKVDNSLFIDALFVDLKFRNRNIGMNLLVSAKDKAINNYFKSLSLIVLADNVAAIKLYEKFGFKIIKNVDIKPCELIPHEGGGYLMECKLINS